MSDEHATPNDKLAYLTKQLDKRATVLHSSVAWYRGRYYVSTMSTVRPIRPDYGYRRVET